MTKSEKLADEIFKHINNNILLNKNATLEDYVAVSVLIKKHFEQIHNEAVEMTVMAENKKTFVKPQYNDQI